MRWVECGERMKFNVPIPVGQEVPSIKQAVLRFSFRYHHYGRLQVVLVWGSTCASDTQQRSVHLADSASSASSRFYIRSTPQRFQKKYTANGFMSS
jgi:hypothetical protein